MRRFSAKIAVTTIAATMAFGGTAAASEVTVQSGDSLWSIAEENGTTADELQELNNLSSDVIHVGDTLQTSSGGSSSADQATSSSSGDAGGNVESYIDTAKSQMGAPYEWGGETPAGFDCSGFINYAIDGEGLPRTVIEMYNSLTPVDSPERGDIVFFDTSGGPSHAGIYLGGGDFIHAGASTGVTVDNMNSGYWSSAYVGARTY